MDRAIMRWIRDWNETRSVEMIGQKPLGEYPNENQAKRGPAVNGNVPNWAAGNRATRPWGMGGLEGGSRRT